MTDPLFSPLALRLARPLLLAAALAAANTSAAPLQGPAGVAADIQFWYSASHGTLTTGDVPAENGEQVLVWEDYSGNGRHAERGGAQGAILGSEGLNFNPTLQFPGDRFYTTDDSGLAAGGSERSIFMVASTADIGSWRYVFGSGTKGSSLGFDFGNQSGAGTIFLTTHSGQEAFTGSWLPTGSARLAYGSVVSGALYLAVNGGPLTGGAAGVNTVLDGDINIGSNTAGQEIWNGSIAEVIFYNRAVSAEERQRVNSYLALKYGFSLDQSTPQSYLATGSALMWDKDAAHAATWNRDLFGIGRDDTSSLAQIKSRDQNSEGIITLEAVGEGSNGNGAFTDIDDLEFFVIGHDGGEATWTASGAPTGYRILERTWRKQEQGGDNDVGQLRIDVQVEHGAFNLPLPDDDGAYYFIYDRDDDGSLADETPQQMNDLGGNVWRHDQDFGTGSLFTFATMQEVSNALPVFSALDTLGITAEDTAFTLAYGTLASKADVSDSDGSVVAYRVSALTDGTLNIGGLPYAAGSNDLIASGTTLVWTPPANANGLLAAFTLVAVDDEGGESAAERQAWIQVTAVNDAPTLTSAIGDRNGTQGVSFSLDVSGHFGDVDGDALTFSASGLPTGLTISSTGLISGTPDNAAALASPHTVTVRATDPAGARARGSFTLTIANANDAPTLTSAIGDRNGTQGVSFSLDVSGHFGDVDGDALTFSASGLPAGLTISSAGLISGTLTATGIFTVTLTATDPGALEATTTFRLSIQPPPVTDTVISTTEPGGVLSGSIRITPSGVLDGGSIDGTVTNAGTIRGTVTLAAGSAIDGGIIAGALTGSPLQPAVLSDAHITGEASLSHVVIGANTQLSPDAAIGANVRFVSNALIPAHLDLTGTFRMLNWTTGDVRSVAILDDDVLVSGDSGQTLSIIRAIQLLDVYEPAGNALHQDDDTGEIVVFTDETRSAVLPGRVSQAPAAAEPGTFITVDGDVAFVTANRRLVLGYPVLGSKEVFGTVLERFGMRLDFDARANLLVSPREDADGGFPQQDSPDLSRRLSALSAGEHDYRYSGRPEVSALPAADDRREGLHLQPMPGLRNASLVSLVFIDEQGRRLEQDLVPMPADWAALKVALAAMPGIQDIRIGTDGIIVVDFNGRERRGRVTYRVVQTGIPSPDPEAGLVLEPAGDVNGDGTLDYTLFYPNGDVQLLLVFPIPVEP